MQKFDHSPTPRNTRVTFRGPPAGCDTDVSRGRGSYMQHVFTPRRGRYPRMAAPMLDMGRAKLIMSIGLWGGAGGEYDGWQWRWGFGIRAALWGGSWLDMRTTTPWHIRVTPSGRPVGCDTGVPRCGLWVPYNAEIEPPPRRGTPVSHPVGRPRGVTRMCRGVVVRKCFSGGSGRGNGEAGGADDVGAVECSLCMRGGS